MPGVPSSGPAESHRFSGDPSWKRAARRAAGVGSEVLRESPGAARRLIQLQAPVPDRTDRTGSLQLQTPGGATEVGAARKDRG